MPRYKVNTKTANSVREVAGDKANIVEGRLEIVKTVAGKDTPVAVFASGEWQNYEVQDG